MREKIEGITADFYINRKPVDIEFFCPYCGVRVNVEWHYVNEPESWSDDWGWVMCPFCERDVKLGDYDIG